MVPCLRAALVLGVAVHWLCFRRLTATSPNLDIFEARGLMVCFGLMFLVQNFASWVWGGDLRGYDYLAEPVPIPGAARSSPPTSCWCWCCRCCSAAR